MPRVIGTCDGHGTLQSPRIACMQALRTIYDEYNDEEITLTKEELRMIMAIRKGHFPHVEINPYEPYNDWWVWEQACGPSHACCTCLCTQKPQLAVQGGDTSTCEQDIEAHAICRTA
jgi:hypothetical protein